MSRLLTYGILQQKNVGFRNPLLDYTDGASVSYSLRLLKSDYSGYCIKVRRSSDNATQDIGFVNNIIDEDAILDFVGANDGFIDTWYDQSGNSKNATQATTAKQPKIVSSGTSEKEGTRLIINFGTNSDHWYLMLPTGFLYNTASISVFMTAKITSWTSQNSGIFAPYNNYNKGFEIQQLQVNYGYLRINGIVRTGNNVVNALFENNTLSVANIFADSMETTAYKNNTEINLISNTGISALNFNGIYGIGTYATNLNTIYNMYGKISEIIIYESNQIANRINIVANIKKFYFL